MSNYHDRPESRTYAVFPFDPTNHYPANSAISKPYKVRSAAEKAADKAMLNTAPIPDGGFVVRQYRAPKQSPT